VDSTGGQGGFTSPRNGIGYIINCHYKPKNADFMDFFPIFWPGLPGSKIVDATKGLKHTFSFFRIGSQLSLVMFKLKDGRHRKLHLVMRTLMVCLPKEGRYVHVQRISSVLLPGFQKGRDIEAS
jgi:hypothetical protein